MPSRYHHPQTLLHMQAYRIGTILQPWANLVPPLHGGVYCKSGLNNGDIDALEDNGCGLSSKTAVCWSSSTSTPNSRVQDAENTAVVRKQMTETREETHLFTEE